MTENIKLEEARALGYETIAQAHEQSRWLSEIGLNHAAETGYQSSAAAAQKRTELSAPESTWIPKFNNANMQDVNKKLKAVVVYGGKNDPYIDIDVYVRMPDNSEYLRHAYATIQNPERIIHDGIRYSSAPSNDFGDEGVECPAAVMQAFEAASEDVIALIQSHSSGHAAVEKWTVDLLLNTLEAGGRIEPFSDTYAKIFERVPSQEAPAYTQPVLVSRSNAEEALRRYSGDAPVDERAVVDRPRG